MHCQQQRRQRGKRKEEVLYGKKRATRELRLRLWKLGTEEAVTAVGLEDRGWIG